MKMKKSREDLEQKILHMKFSELGKRGSAARWNDDHVSKKSLANRLTDALRREEKFKRKLAEAREEVDAIMREISQQRDGGITTTQAVVLEMLRQRKCNKDIAAERNISLRTVKFHVASLLKKYGYTSRTDFYYGAKNENQIA
jgi:DNA-binding NarL/FixJ family response regulator